MNVYNLIMHCSTKKIAETIPNNQPFSEATCNAVFSPLSLSFKSAFSKISETIFSKPCALATCIAICPFLFFTFKSAPLATSCFTMFSFSLDEKCNQFLLCYLIQKFLLGKYHQLQHDEAWYLRFHLLHLNQFRLLHLLGVNWWYFHYLESQIVTVFVSIFSSKFYEWQKRMQYFDQIQKYNRLPFSIARSNGIFPFKFFLLRSPPFWMSICITFSVPGNYDYFIIQSMKKIEFWMHLIIYQMKPKYERDCRPSYRHG